MNTLAMMFNAFSMSHAEVKRSFRRAIGRSTGARFKNDQMTVATARSLLLAYAMAFRAKRDIAFYSAPRM